MAEQAVDDAISANPQEAREYLERTVVPVLMLGLQSMCRDRPINPADYLAMYLLKRSTKRNIAVEVPLSDTVPELPGKAQS